MTIRMKESSGELAVGGSNRHARGCIIFNETSQQAAVAAMLADTTNFPTSYSPVIGGVTYNFFRGTASARPLDSQDSPTTWEGEVDYVLVATPEPYQTGDSVTSFEVGMQSVNMKASPFGGPYAAYSGVADAPDFGGLINVTKDSVDGADVDLPVFTWSETHYVANASVTTSYINAVWAVASAPINDDTFRNFPAGSVKFLGVSGTRRGKNGDWELTFKFAASPNVVDMEIGSAAMKDAIEDAEYPGGAPMGWSVGHITGIDKYGWQYLWIRYREHEALFGSTKELIQAPEVVYVENVYGWSDFANLGIGTS